jgi:hypothetical protein
VYTPHRQGGILPFLHSGEFAVIDRASETPYLFSGDHGDAMKYFRYRNRPYAPDDEWYHRSDPDAPAVDWNQVASQYQYLVVTKPFDSRRIPVDGRVLAENEVAAVLALRGPVD